MVKMNFRKQKGITLVALVITIIVLLILAGVTLNIVLNSGIINKSQTATSKYNEQAAKEKLTLALTEYKFKQLAGETPDLATIISNIGGDVTGGTGTSDTEWTIELDGFRFIVDKKSNGITSIEPSNTKLLALPEISSTINYANDYKSATIEVTVTPKNEGGTITAVTIDNQTITEANGKYSLIVNTNGNREIKATETVDGRTKTATAIANVNQIEVTKYSVTVTKTDGSGISAVNGGGEIEEGKNTQISATIEDGKVFAGWVVVSGNATDVADLKANPTTVTPTAAITLRATAGGPASKSTTGDGYVGCYADVDGNGTIDGIIYADLLVGKPTENWGSDGTYMIPPENYGLTIENVKDYVVSSTQVTNEHFEASGADPSTYTPRYLVSPASNTSNKKDRFYVMALEDIKYGTNDYLYWYYYAYSSGKGKMENYATDTSVDFGAGKTNTENMMNIYYERNGKTKYADQYDADIWKNIDNKVSQGWFVPSRGEWAAFAKALNISKTSTDATYYEKFGLKNKYYSSSQKDKSLAWTVDFDSGYMSWSNVSYSRYARLSTTF